jgi:hypothetical protein
MKSVSFPSNENISHAPEHHPTCESDPKQVTIHTRINPINQLQLRSKIQFHPIPSQCLRTNQKSVNGYLVRGKT